MNREGSDKPDPQKGTLNGEPLADKDQRPEEPDIHQRGAGE